MRRVPIKIRRCVSLYFFPAIVARARARARVHERNYIPSCVQFSIYSPPRQLAFSPRHFSKWNFCSRLLQMQISFRSPCGIPVHPRETNVRHFFPIGNHANSIRGTRESSSRSLSSVELSDHLESLRDPRSACVSMRGKS